MRKKVVNGIQFASVVLALVLGMATAKKIPFESILKGREEPVTLAMTENGLLDDFIGKPAGEDIPRIEDAKTWEDTWQTSCVTIEPVGIVSTGVGVRHPWIDPYRSTTRRGGSRRRADVSNARLDILDEYGEYYLLQLPDESYILAQMSVRDAERVKGGRAITLPVGRKVPAHGQALDRIAELCREYSVNTDGVFYCIDDQWNEKNSTLLLLLRIGTIAVITIVVGFILILLTDKFLGEKQGKKAS